MSSVPHPLWVELDDEPTVSFWREPQAMPLQCAPIGWPLLASIGTLTQPLMRPGLGGGETANASVTLDDTSGVLARRWAAPPLRRAARVCSPEGALFSGFVTGWEGGARTTLRIEGGARWALTDPLALRTSAVWGAWKHVAALPIVYGACTLRPVQYDQQGQMFLLADHPIAGVDAVTRDDAPSAQWALHHATDVTGKPCAFIELGTPLAPGERLAVTLRGKLHPYTGEPLQAPHEVLEDLVVRVIGLSVPSGAFDMLRAQCGDWRIGAVFSDEKMTQRQAIDAVCQSIGAAWSADADFFARLWPGDAHPARMTINAMNARDMQASAQHGDIATVLRVLYDRDDATGQPRRAIQLAAPDAVSRYGRIEREWQAPFLRSPRHAQQLGQRLLQWMAQPVWTLQWRMSYEAVRPADALHIEHPCMAPHGTATVTSVQIDPSRAEVGVQAQVPSAQPPDVVVERLSQAFSPSIQSGAVVEYADGKAAFTLRGESAEPLAGAKVVFDGKITRYADALGRVVFTASRGAHRLSVTATGYAPMDIEVTV